MPLSFCCRKHFKELMFVGRTARHFAKLREDQTRRRHDCRRGTQECARHIIGSLGQK